jgi:hypothetical protein
MFDRYFRDMDEAERLKDALEDWQSATGIWRDACRIYAHKLLMRMIRERDAGRAKLKAAAERARERQVGC